MSIYRFIGLAVFGSVTFIGGYIFGGWSTYDKNLLDEIRKTHEIKSEFISEAMKLSHELSSFKQLKYIEENGDLDKAIEFQESLVRGQLLKLESQFKRLPAREREIFFKPLIDDVKETIGPDI